MYGTVQHNVKTRCAAHAQHCQDSATCEMLPLMQCMLDACIASNFTQVRALNAYVVVFEVTCTSEVTRESVNDITMGPLV